MAIDNTGSPSKYTSSSDESAAAARRRAGLTASAKSAAKKPAAKKTKTIVTPGTKVSQKTIDNIKSMGMSKTLEALKSIGQPGSKNVPASKEFIEGARRMYGSRVDKYLPSTAGMGRSSSGMKNKTAGMGRASSGMSKAAPKPVAKNNTKSNVIKGTLGAAAAIGVLAASKGKGASVAAKLSPAVGGFAKSAVGKALFGSGKPLTSKAFTAAKAAPKPNAAKVTVGPKGSFGKTTLQQAKSGLGTASEYASKAGQAAARKTIQSRPAASADAARATAGKVTVGKKGSFGATTLSKKTKSK